MRRWLTCGVWFLAMAILAGCGSNGDAPKGDAKTTGGGSAEKQSSGPAKDWDPAAGTATIQGVVKFLGKPPKRRAIDMAGKPECAQHESPILDESIIVNPDGSLKNAFVWVKTGLKGWKFTPPATPVVLDQKGCQFSPHVQGAQVGQPVVIRNSDAFAHNVNCLSVRNPGFNFTQGRQGQEDTKQFQSPEVLFKLKCDIHGWMKGFIGAVDHPFFAVTGPDGKYELKGLPPGDYEVEAWHESFGTSSQKVNLAAKQTHQLPFVFESGK